MDVAELIKIHEGDIVASWTDRVARLPGEDSLPEPLLLDHMPDLLQRLAEWTEHPVADQQSQVERMASHHALQRLGHGFGLRQIVTEYRILRGAILDLVEARYPGLPISRLARLDAAIDHAIAECVEVYSGAVELARERFVDMLGHDLRGPLSVVLMAAGSLVRSEGVDAATTKKLGARIARNASRMAGMIEDLLDFARGKRGQGIPVELAPADMGDICRAAIDELAFANPGRTVAFAGEGDLRGEWDADRVTQAVSNLISNALLHGEDPVRLLARDRGDEVVVVVENGGTPIEPTRLATIFEPYQALASEAEARTRVGLGLGLFIVREVVRAHGGDVEVTSDAKTTVFTTRWPRHPGTRPANEPPTASA